MSRAKSQSFRRLTRKKGELTLEEFSEHGLIKESDANRAFKVGVVVEHNKTKQRSNIIETLTHEVDIEKVGAETMVEERAKNLVAYSTLVDEYRVLKVKDELFVHGADLQDPLKSQASLNAEGQSCITLGLQREWAANLEHNSKVDVCIHPKRRVVANVKINKSSKMQLVGLSTKIQFTDKKPDVTDHAVVALVVPDVKKGGKLHGVVNPQRPGAADAKKGGTVIAHWCIRGIEDESLANVKRTVLKTTVHTSADAKGNGTVVMVPCTINTKAIEAGQELFYHEPKKEEEPTQPLAKRSRVSVA